MIDKKILIVDDEAGLRELYTLLFPTEEYKVICTGSAEDALEILAKEKIYVYFLDLNLPGMDGVELCKKIRQDEPFAYISAVTGYSSMIHRNYYRNAGFDDYFAKPFKVADILRAASHGFERLNRWQG